MLRARRKSDDQTVTAGWQLKPDAGFVCPECGETVLLRKSEGGTSHFIHRRRCNCKYAAGETEAHRRCKMEIYKALLHEPNVTKAALERPLGTVRPDVSAYINGVPVAIEVQISNLSVENIVYRTREYARKGIYVLWLAQWTPDLEERRCTPRPWQKWVQAAYFGQVYYWVEGLKVVSYRFEPSYRTVPRMTWFTENGRKRTGGGYARRSKCVRLAVRGPNHNIATDFSPKDRDWWEGNGLTIPPAKLFMQPYRHSKRAG